MLRASGGPGRVAALDGREDSRVEQDDTDGKPVEGQLATGFGQARERVGARLAAARVAAGVELVDIARDTRIPLRHLRAIEADAHDELPALPYSIGFVKSLARAVGVDADEAAAQFRRETTKVAHVPVAAALEPLDERRLPSRGLVTASVAALLLVVGGLTAYGAGWFETTPEVAVADATAVTEPAVVAPDAPVDDTTAGSDAAPLVSGDTAPAAMPVAAPGGPSAVRIVALDDAWIRITALDPATGKIVSVRTGLLTKGERVDLPAEPAGQRLWTGRAGALQLSVGGRVVPPLGAPVETIKNVSLAPGDLIARLAPAAAAAR